MNLTFQQTMESNTSEEWEVFHRVFGSDFATVVLPVIYFIIFIIGAAGNVAVLFIILSSKEVKIWEIYLINLAASDLALLLTLPLWATYFALGSKWIFGWWSCKIASFVASSSKYGNVTFMSLIAGERMCRLLYPKFRHDYRLKKKARYMVFAVWLIVLSLGLIALFFRDEITDPETGHHHCTWSFDENIHSHKYWYSVHFVLSLVIGFLLPFSFILTCYTVVVIHLKKKPCAHQNVYVRMMKASKTVIVIIFVFLVCWIPNEISASVFILQDLFPSLPKVSLQQEVIHHYVHLVTTCLAWSHSCWNPLLYMLVQEDVKKQLADLRQIKLSLLRSTQHSKNVSRQEQVQLKTTVNQPANYASNMNQASEGNMENPAVVEQPCTRV